MKSLHQIVIILLLLIIGNTSLSAIGEKEDTQIRFLNHSSFKEIQKIAKKKNKPIFIDFYSAYCGPCKIMNKKVFQEKQVAQYMNKNFINYKVDIKKGNGPLLSLVYDVKYLPTVIIVTPEGEILAKKISLMGADKFLSWAKETYKTHMAQVEKTVPSSYKKRKESNKTQTVFVDRIRRVSPTIR